MFGPPGRGLEEWGSFDKNPQLTPFMNQVKPAILESIDKPHIKDFQYSTSFLFSCLSSVRDNIPQLAHMDLKSEITQAEYDLIQTKSMIGFTPINEDGMMILVWTEGTPKTYRDQDQIDEDNKREEEDIYVTPGQYFLYIPRGVFVALPGDTIHAGGFCFGKKIPCPSNKNAIKNSKKKQPKVEEHYFQNQSLHFTICFSKKAANDVQYDISITVIDEDEERFKNDFKPDEDTMKILFKYVLDCHPKIIGEDDDSDLNMKVASLKN